MTWADARTALTTVLNGLQVTADGYSPEQLTCSEFPPDGDDQPYPFAFVIPPAREVVRGANGLRRVTVNQVKVRVLLHAERQSEASARMEAWIPVLIDAIGDNITLNDGSGLVLGQKFSEFSTYGPDGLPPYGFDMDLDVQITDVETRGA